MESVGLIRERGVTQECGTTRGGREQQGSAGVIEECVRAAGEGGSNRGVWE